MTDERPIVTAGMLSSMSAEDVKAKMAVIMKTQCPLALWVHGVQSASYARGVNDGDGDGDDDYDEYDDDDDY